MPDESKLVLLVDNDQGAEGVLRTHLEGKGTLLVASTTIEGWELFQQNRHAMSLLIVWAGAKNLLPFLQMVKAAENQLPIMIKSGDPDNWEPWLENGLCDYGTTGADLLPKVRKVFGWPDPM